MGGGCQSKEGGSGQVGDWRKCIGRFHCWGGVGE